jgi:hypothetical protein
MAFMRRTAEGLAVLEAADKDVFDLLFNSNPKYGDMAVPKNLQGKMEKGLGGAKHLAQVFLANVQNGIDFDLIGRRASGYEAAAMVATHEGLHALGVRGSRRAEALVRLAEIKFLGVEVDRKVIRQVLQDMGKNYHQFPWKVGKTLAEFAGWKW